MDALLAAKAKGNCALAVGGGRCLLAQAQERRGEQIDDFLMRVARGVRRGERFVLSHGRRSMEERCSC